MTICFHTLGCKVNQYETEVMAERMQKAGYTLAKADGDCDVIVINSCTVTGESDAKVRKLLRRCRREHPGAVIAVTGCYPQAVDGAADALPEADIVMGTRNRAFLPSYVEDFLEHRQRIVAIRAHEEGEDFEGMQVQAFEERTRAFVKIQDGCNRYCSYCIIPTARGPIRSKPLASIKEELATLAKAGYREAVLVGINLSAYGEESGLALPDAIEAAASVEGIERIRLGSLEPDKFDDAFIARLAACQKLCGQFHLSLQSGCGETLRRMNRHYTPKDYEKVVTRLREAFPNCAITTDVMVGFPGETEEEFKESLAFVKRIRFSKVHTFAYSPRPGTVAAGSAGQVPKEEKERRSRRMIAETAADRAAFLKAQAGREEPVLFEQEAASGVWEGYTPNYTPVRVCSGTALNGRILPVRLTGSYGDWCVGRLAEPQEEEEA